MTGWHLWYTVRKLIRYCLKVREDNPNDLVAEIARTESEDFFASRRIAFQNRKEIQFSLPTIAMINMLKITDHVRLTCGVNALYRDAFESQFRY